ncbi:hypothetical protein OJAV_G00113120 [Oryzias javanicus]|uniref:Apolipoprotein A-II n=1 Tax=Oryzias javanicus TaxID=123683 RepID=A0A3S2P8A8_ORYJA|nr:hypothetical protein OJAV_G00113120 [Oryzias javanicus]
MGQESCRETSASLHSLCTTGLCSSAAMKLSIIATVVVLVLAHGAFADELEDLLKDIQAKMSKDFREIVDNPEVQNQAKVFLEEKKGQLEPAVEQIQPHVDPFIEKVQTFFDKLRYELAKTSKK